MLLATALVMLFVAGARIRDFVVFFSVAVAAMVALAITSPYRMKRLTGFLDPWSDPYDSGFQLIQSLIAAQEQNGGWITQELTEAVADYLELPRVWAHEVVSFYSMFFTSPVGRHKVHICTNISCWLNGADELVAHAEKKLGVKLGGTTGDGRITLVREEECLAGCCGAPMARTMTTPSRWFLDLCF